MGNYLLGMMVGGFLGISVMCIMQISGHDCDK